MVMVCNIKLSLPIFFKWIFTLSDMYETDRSRYSLDGLNTSGGSCQCALPCLLIRARCSRKHAALQLGYTSTHSIAYTRALVPN